MKRGNHVALLMVMPPRVIVVLGCTAREEGGTYTVPTSWNLIFPRILGMSRLEAAAVTGCPE